MKLSRAKISSDSLATKSIAKRAISAGARRWLLAAALALTPMLATATTARADDNDEPIDARFEGFGQGRTVYLPDVGDATIWFLFVGLTILTLGVTFKSGNRSHLD